MSRQQATNRELGVDTARANLFTNPGIDTWQRGAGPFTSGYSADAWMLYVAASCTLTVTRESTIKMPDSLYSAKLVSTGTGQTGSFYNHMVKDMVQHLRGRVVTIGAWVRTATANGARMQVYQAPGSMFFGTQHSGGDTWQFLTATGTIDPTATDWHPEIATTGAVTAYVDNATLTVGNVPADYAPLHPADDLMRCQRYYERLSDDADAALQIMAYAGVAGQYGVVVLPFKVTKAVVPTVTLVGTWSTSNCPVPTVASSGKQGTRLQVAATAAGQFYAYNGGAGSTIVAEANP